MNFVTVSDKNYLSKGLAMIDSILKAELLLDDPDTTHHFYYGCLDIETFSILSKINAYYITPICILPEEDLSGKDYVQWCWKQAPIFTANTQVREGGPITYVDADCHFYRPFRELGALNKSAGFVEHRIPNTKNVGRFNVGVVYFEDPYLSMKWKNCVVNPHLYPEEYGTCGDQKYLELLYDDSTVEIFDCGHGAWWNNYQYTWTTPYRVIRNGREEDIIFMHFSHFDLLPTSGWQCKDERRMQKPLIELYTSYEKTLRNIEEKINKYAN